MKTAQKYLKSRTVWVFIVLFVTNGLPAVRDLIPMNVLTLIDAVLVTAGAYFRMNPSVTSAASQMPPEQPTE